MAGPSDEREEGLGTTLSRRRALRLAVGVVGSGALFSRAAGAQSREAAASAGEFPSGAALAREAAPAPGPGQVPDLMSLVNLHDFEELARRRLSIRTYDYIAAGSADDLTLQENMAAFERFWIRRRVMRDASGVDTSVELLGQRLEHPILLGPVGLRNLLQEDGHRLTALAAANTGAVLVGVSANLMEELAAEGRAPLWWAMSLGHAERGDAAAWAERNQAAGASALCVSIDYPYTASRDRPARHGWEREWSSTGVYGTSDGEIVFQPGAIDPYTPELTWDWIDWVREASDLPVVLKGIVTGADARIAVERGADAVVVSNHGGRTLDGTRGTLDALPDVVTAVDGRIPVLVDGGIRRGGDVLKALGLGATAILIGRPYLWGLGTYGQPGVERVVELLRGELSIALGLSGSPRAASVDRNLVQAAWRPFAV